MSFLTDEERSKVVEIAKSWLKTPYVPNGKLKGIGVDCLQFVACVYAEAGVFDYESEPDLVSNYSVNVHQHCSDPRYLEGLKRHSVQVKQEEIKPGDVIIYFLGRGYAHAGIVMDQETLIHAVQVNSIGVTYTNPTREPMLRRAKKCYLAFRKVDK